MDLSCAFPPGPDVVDHVRLAEELGYTRAWIYDSPALYGDVWVQLALCAQATDQIGLGTGVMVPSLRHPMVTAAAIAHLEQLAPGRLAVAIGTGFTARLVLGQDPLRWAEVQRFIDQLQTLLAGGATEIDGHMCQMIHPGGQVADRPLPTPLLVAANGPKGIGVAHDVDAAGIISAFGPIGGWDWSALFAYGTVLDPDEPLDSPRVIDAAGPGAAVVFHGMYAADPTLLDGLEGGPEWRAAIEAFPPEERHVRTHEGHFSHLTDRDRASISGELIATTTWTGSPAELRSRLADTEAAGTTELAYAPMGPDIPRELRAVRALMD